MGSRFKGSRFKVLKIQGFGLHPAGSRDYDPSGLAATSQAAFKGSGLLCPNIVEFIYFAQTNTFRNNMSSLSQTLALGYFQPLNL